VQILAGGVGSRFWPASTRARPKQLLPLASEQPLILDTVERARSLVPDEQLHILAGSHLAEPFRRAVPDLPSSSYLLEPKARGTCPVLAWAAWQIRRRDPDAVLVSLHADHLIRPLAGFRETVAAATALARSQDLLLTVGVVPDRVETGYGHIQPGDALPTAGSAVAHRVAAFHEKPDAETARRYMEAGYLWNTGIFVWKAGVFLEEVERHAPEVARCLPILEAEGAEAFFDAVPSCVVDRAVMERTRRAATVEATFEWDDVGSWQALSRTRTGDEQGNVVEGSARVVDSHDNVVYAEEGTIVLYGVDDLVVVAAGGTTLVMPRERATHLKELLAEMENGEQ